MSQTWKTIHNRWWAASFCSFLLPLSWKSFLLIIIKDKDGAGSRSGYVSQPADQPGGKHKGKHQVVHPVLRHQMLTEQWSYLFSLCWEIHTVDSVQLFGLPKKKKNQHMIQDNQLMTIWLCLLWALCQTADLSHNLIISHRGKLFCSCAHWQKFHLLDEQSTTQVCRHD